MSGLDFSTVIASTVHDMKNSLAMLGQAHAQWLAQLPVELQGGDQREIEDEEDRVEEARLLLEHPWSRSRPRTRDGYSLQAVPRRRCGQSALRGGSVRACKL